jgi:hypothetical protein
MLLCNGCLGLSFGEGWQKGTFRKREWCDLERGGLWWGCLDTGVCGRLAQ